MGYAGETCLLDTADDAGLNALAPLEKAISALQREILDNVFWIALIVVEDNEDRRILHVVHARIVQITLGIEVICTWRSTVTTCADGVRTNQYPGQKHVAMMTLTWFCVIFAI